MARFVGRQPWSGGGVARLSCGWERQFKINSTSLSFHLAESQFRESKRGLARCARLSWGWEFQFKRNSTSLSFHLAESQFLSKLNTAILLNEKRPKYGAFLLNRGRKRIRTAVKGFADPCLAARPSDLFRAANIIKISANLKNN